MIDNNKILFISVARIPSNSPLSELHSTISIGIIIDYTSGDVVGATTTFISDDVNEFFKKIVIGHNLHKEGVEGILDELEFAFNGSSKKAVSVCIRSNFEKYIIWRKENNFALVE